MREKVKATVTVEAAVIIPLIMLIFMLTVQLLFYYHDKNVIGAAAYETIAVGSGREERTADEMETYFQDRIYGRLMLFSTVDAEVTIEKEETSINCVAQESRMLLKLERKIAITEPEKFIRNLRKIEKSLGENE